MKTGVQQTIRGRLMRFSNREGQNMFSPAIFFAIWLRRGFVVVAIAIIAVIASPLIAAVQFGVATNFPAGSPPSSLVVSDFDKDGKLDIAILSGYSVSVILGKGDGTFVTHTNYSVTGFAAGLVACNLNNDDKSDIVVGGSYGGSVLLGDGTGKFVKTNFFWGDAYYSLGVAVGDLNGDGILDLANATDRGSGNVAVAFGKGDGTFGSSTNYSLADKPCDIAAGDIYGNGKPDLLMSLKYYLNSSSNSFCVLSNKGNGTFAAPRYYTCTNIVDSHYALKLLDFNGDGKLDVAVINYNAKSITVWLNNGSGVFVPTYNYSLGFQPTSIASGDFSCDGKIDLIVRGGAAAKVLLGHGDGSFTFSPQMSVPSSLDRHDTIMAGDFNRDGMPDIAVVNYNNNSVAIMLNQTLPTLEITPMAGYNQISWIAALGNGFTIEYTTDLSAPDSWLPFPYPPVLIGNQKAIADWASGQKKFYRLRKP